MTIAIIVLVCLFVIALSLITYGYHILPEQETPNLQNKIEFKKARKLFGYGALALVFATLFLYCVLVFVAWA